MLFVIVVLFAVPGFMQQADGFIEQMRFARKATSDGQVHQLVYELLDVLVLAGHDSLSLHGNGDMLVCFATTNESNSAALHRVVFCYALIGFSIFAALPDIHNVLWS